MVRKLKTFIIIIYPEIPYSELRNMVRFFFPDLPLYARKFTKTETGVGSHEMWEISTRSRGRDVA